MLKKLFIKSMLMLIYTVVLFVIATLIQDNIIVTDLLYASLVFFIIYSLLVTFYDFVFDSLLLLASYGLMALAYINVLNGWIFIGCVIFSCILISEIINNFYSHR